MPRWQADSSGFVSRLAAVRPVRQERKPHVLAERLGQQLQIVMVASRARARPDRTVARARSGEQIAITWGDIDSFNNAVVFRRASSRGVVRPTKDGEEGRVPMTSRVAAALKSILLAEGHGSPCGGCAIPGSSPPFSRPFAPGGSAVRGASAIDEDTLDADAIIRWLGASDGAAATFASELVRRRLAFDNSIAHAVRCAVEAGRIEDRR
jgi:integrase